MPQRSRYLQVLPLAASLALLCAATAVHAQDSLSRPPKTAKVPKSERPVRTDRTPPLFATESPVSMTLTANLGQLRRDKADKAPWRPSVLAYTGDDAKPVTVSARVRTRGIWRLRNCEFPPLRLAFSGKASKQTLLDDLEKPKLVSYCRNSDRYEQYILQELQLYRIYRKLTPVSHQVRLLRLQYVDSASGKVEATRWAFMVEDPAELAARLQGSVIETKGAGADDLDPFQGALAYVFEYLIGNTDFSFNGLHNTELIGTTDGTLLPLAYDFDFAGAVNATYATVDPQMNVKRVRDRQYRGYCKFNSQLPRVFALFEQQHDAIIALYQDEIGRLMNPAVAKETVEYIEEFYTTIRDVRAVERRMLNTCVGPH